jgi:rRNA maturation RNase YbeY
LKRKIKKAGMKRAVRINLIARCGAAHASFIRRHLQLAHEILRPPLQDLSIALVGDREMSDLHLRFMAIAGPTDVLTFPLEMDSAGNILSGEVIICVPEARRRVVELSTQLPCELLLYAIHGMLHLSGYDDRTARDFKVMHRTEDDLLTKLGIGPVFASPAMKPERPGKQKVR